VDLKPEYFIHSSEDWLVFPHEVSGLNPQEIAEGKADFKNIQELFL
jgi:hypothetical protein